MEMKNLLKLHLLNSDVEYFQWVLNLYRQNELIIAERKFSVMTLEYRKLFVKTMLFGSGWSVSKKAKQFFFNILMKSFK